MPSIAGLTQGVGDSGPWLLLNATAINEAGIFAGGRRSLAGPTAPPHGLYLQWIKSEAGDAPAEEAPAIDIPAAPALEAPFHLLLPGRAAREPRPTLGGT